MLFNFPCNKLGLGMCLAIVQLVTIDVALATGELTSSNAYAYEANEKSGSRRMFIYEQPVRGVVQLNVEGGFTASATKVTTSRTISKSSSDAMTTNISAGYGITDNLYTAVRFNHQSGNISQQVIESGERSNPEYTIKTEGLDEPTLLLGSQFALKDSQIFAELEVDIGMGDQIEHNNTRTGATRNGLQGGSNYTPRIIFSHDVGDVIIGGKVSYTISDKKVTRFDRSTSEEKGGNKIEVLGGVEFEHLSRLGFLAGYLLQDNRQITTHSEGPSYTYDSPGVNHLVVGSYCVFQIDKTSSLIPKIAYATALNKTYADSGSNIYIDRLDVWNLSLGARFSF